MDKEFITIRQKETAVKVQNTRINAVRTKDIVKKGVRVYKDGKIGISGAVGDLPDDVLIENAVKNLSTNIEYPYKLSGDRKDHRCYNENPMTGEDLLKYSEDILAVLRRDYPEFDFSESISTTEVQWNMKNTAGLDLEYRDAIIYLGLILKEKKSANLFDGFLMYFGRSLDMDKFWAFNRDYLAAYNNSVPLPEGDVLPVFTFQFNELLGFLANCLNGERYAVGSSIFSGKLNEQLFNDKIVLKQNMDPIYTAEPFFDMEGTVLENDSYTLIDKGRLTGVFTDKRSADMYNLPHTGAASGGYDDMPMLQGAPLRFDVDSEDIKKALGGRPALLVAVSSGGDFTADGSFAAPVQVGFLFDGERINGKVPEFTMSSHLNKMLGEDYIGTFENKHLYLGEGLTLQGFNMKITK